MRLRNRAHREDTRPIDETCECYACRHYSRGALRHLFMARELAAAVLTSIHNVTFYQSLVARCREAIIEGRFAAFREAFVQRYLEQKDPSQP